LQGLIIQAMAVFSFVNVVLLIALIVVYFLVQNLLALYSYLAMFMYYADAVAGIVLAITVTQTVGLVTLLWLSVH